MNSLSKRRHAFTLVEMLIAMAVTLLMMLALARAFSYIGTQVQESRATTTLASELRDVTGRIKRDLDQCTVELRASDSLEEDQNGYFLYYEGPLTDATSSIFRVDDSSGEPVLPDARYGDCDDYLAFTAVAKPGQWFRGKVPRFWVDPTIQNPNLEDLVVIESKYAEIVYFASPEYESGSTTVYIDNDGTIDIDGNGTLDADESQNGFPDRLKIYRRVLLIRPDLNITDANGNVRLPGGITADADPETGLATTVHQICDLSVRRLLNPQGRPTVVVAANSLSDLSQPQNRFGHFRINSGDFTSMPLLALGEQATVLAKNPDLRPLPAVIDPASDRVGFLKPEFVLRGKRLGEDVLTNHALSLDVQIFDPTANFYTQNETVGPNDPGYRDAIEFYVQNPDPTLIRVTKGGFVDLCYPVLAGGTVRGWGQAPKDSRTNNPLQFGAIANSVLLNSEFSGIENLGNNAGNIFTDGLFRSGRVYVNGANILVFQPVFDTYTSSYENDGFLQRLENGQLNWYAQDSSPSTPPLDRGANGLDDLEVVNNSAYAQANRISDDQGERETLPPFSGKAQAIKVSVRIENPAIRLIRQASVEYSGK